MNTTVYRDFSEVNKLQTDIMIVVDTWVRTEKTPIPQKEIIQAMKDAGIKDFTVINAINALLRKGYIRRAYTISNKTYYVQLRRL
jgi:DNA-binding transcriptional regulator PaaX